MVLRNVPKTFTFEEQRIEINNIAQDLHTFESNAINTSSFSVTLDTATGGGSLTYDAGVFTFKPANLTGYLQSESDPTVASHVKGITQADITSWTDTSTDVTNNNAAWGEGASLTLSDLKAVVAASTDFADFQTRVAALT